MVAAHQNHIARFHVTPGFALNPFTVFGAVVLGHTPKGVDPTHFTTSRVAFGHLDGVAGLDSLLVGRNFAPSAAVDDFLVCHL